MNLSIVSREIFGQNKMNIYQNENNDVFMTREQIGQALDYSDPRRAVSRIHRRNKERLDRFSSVVELTTEAGLRETVVYNEKGIYEIIRRSNQPKADAFYDWVYELLSKLRKGELQVTEKPNSRKLLLETALEHEKKIEEIENDVSYLKDNMRIDGTQEFRIRRLANQTVIKALGGKDAPAYKKLSNKVFARFWRDFKNHFTIPRYGELPKAQFDEGIDFINAWQPDTSTRLEIEAVNEQQTLKVVT